MKYFRLIALMALLCNVRAFSQEKNTKHTIVKGETISSIAQLYNVKEAAIFKLNPKAKKTLQLNQIILIPTQHSKKTNAIVEAKENIPELTHEVLAKETIYGIAKQYKVKVSALEKANPLLECDGLKVGQTITIPTKGMSKTAIAALSQGNNAKSTIAEPMMHEVLAKESKYAIAKQYGISMAELNNANPKLGTDGLRVGQKLNIPANAFPNRQTLDANSPIETVAVVNKEIVREVMPKQEQKEIELARKDSTNDKTEKPIVLVSENFDEAIVSKKETNISSESAVPEQGTVHVVLEKETKYAIAKQYGITVAELEKQNPEIVKRLRVGFKLKIGKQDSNSDNVKTMSAESTKEEKEFHKTEIAVAESGNNKVSSFRGDDFIEQLIDTAEDNIGSRYRTGGTSKAGFDCSGLMCTTFGAYDIKLPRTSFEQSSVGTKINTEEAKKGDLIFFKTNGRGRVNHVGMVVEVNEGEIKFIHASVRSGVIVSSTKEKYYSRSFVQVNRVLE